MVSFSIIVPIYNVNKYLRTCFDSLINLECPENVELIFVDDGSTDGSERLIEELIQSASFEGSIKLVHKENGGLASARNAGLAEATGQWIAFVDSDDYVSRDYTSVLASAVDASPKAELFLFNARRVDENNNFGKKLLFHPENNRVSFSDNGEKFIYITDKFLRYADGWEAWNRVYRRDIIKAHGLIFRDTKEVFAEDMLFNLEYLNYVNTEVNLCNILYNYRLNSDSLLQTVDKKTILPRMAKLCDYYFDSIEDIKLKKQFYKIVYQIINFQMEFSLGDLPEEEIYRELTEIRDSSITHRKCFKQMMKEYPFCEEYSQCINWSYLK